MFKKIICTIMAVATCAALAVPVGAANVNTDSTIVASASYSYSCKLFNYAQGHCYANGAWSTYKINIKDPIYFQMRYDWSRYQYQLYYEKVFDNGTKLFANMWFDKYGMTQIEVFNAKGTYHSYTSRYQFKDWQYNKDIYAGVANIVYTISDCSSIISSVKYHL